MKDIKKFRKYAKIAMYVFIGMFACLIVYLGYSVISFGDQWYNTPYNPRIQNSLQNTDAGKISDRNGVELAYTKDNERHYAESKTVRRAMSHTVGDTHGMTVGAESVFAKYLYGINKDLMERWGAVLSGATDKGSDITLTADSALSSFIYKNMDGRDGSCVVINYKTGEILASVSLPAFDPETVTEEEPQDTSLVDRALMGRYPPGSLMKIVTATAAVEQGIDIGYNCSGEDYIGGQKVTCVKAHGAITLESALSESCNCYFAHVSEEIGGSRLKNKAESFGFNKTFNFADIALYKSSFEVSPEKGDVAWAGIGQYKDLVTPLHAAMIAGAIGNDGVMMTPRLLLGAVSGAYSTYEMRSKPYLTVTDEDTADIIEDYMRSAVSSGTGTSAAVRGMDICGKTGTAEYTGEDGEIHDHSWFAGYIADEKTPYALAVIFEGAGYGSRHAAPMAGKIFGYLGENARG